MSFHSPGLNMHRGFNILFGDLGSQVAPCAASGPNWAAQSLATAAQVQAVGYGGGVFVAAGYSGTLAQAFQTTPDGITYTNRSATYGGSGPTRRNGVAYGTTAVGTGFFAVGFGQSAVHSFDGGVTWGNDNSTIPNLLWGGASFIVNRFWLVQSSGTATLYWTTGNGTYTSFNSGVASTGGWLGPVSTNPSSSSATVLLVDSGSSLVRRTTDNFGTLNTVGAWPVASLGGAGTKLCFGNGIWVIIGGSQTQFAYSLDNGTSWHLSNSFLSPGSTTWTDVIFVPSSIGGGFFLACSGSPIGAAGVVMTSTDGVTWTRVPHNLPFSGTLQLNWYLATNATGTVLVACSGNASNQSLCASGIC